MAVVVGSTAGLPLPGKSLNVLEMKEKKCPGIVQNALEIPGN